MKFEEQGYVLLEGLLAREEAKALLDDLVQLELEPLRGGIRRIEQRVPAVAALAVSSRMLDVARRYLSGEPRLVRAIYFDKSPGNNWFVTWHQDQTVSVSARFEHEEWGPWTLKAGAWHVQPPLAVLDEMVTVRIHLDPATRDNGCLKVMPGSHRLGLLDADKAFDKVVREQVVYCESPQGGAVVMRPHILHASEKSAVDTPRRILHFEYSSFRLPDGVSWAA